MVGIYDCYSCMSICHLKEVFFFSALKGSDFLKGSFLVFFFQCSLHKKFSVVEIKKDDFQSLSKNFLMVESKNWEVCPP